MQEKIVSAVKEALVLANTIPTGSLSGMESRLGRWSHGIFTKYGMIHADRLSHTAPS